MTLIVPSKARPRTWESIAGFQSESNMTTVSAVCRLRPRPPARVDSRKQNAADPSALKSCGAGGGARKCS